MTGIVSTNVPQLNGVKSFVLPMSYLFRCVLHNLVGAMCLVLIQGGLYVGSNFLLRYIGLVPFVGQYPLFCSRKVYQGVFQFRPSRHLRKFRGFIRHLMERATRRVGVSVFGPYVSHRLVHFWGLVVHIGSSGYFRLLVIY